MIIYFCDRNLKITGNASTVLDNRKKIVSDSTTEEIASAKTIALLYASSRVFSLPPISIKKTFSLKSWLNIFFLAYKVSLTIPLYLVSK